MEKCSQVLLLVKLESNACESNTPQLMFFTYFKLYKWHQIVQNITYESGSKQWM